MSIAAGATLLWSDIKKLYTDTYDTPRTYNNHHNELWEWGPRWRHGQNGSSSFPREDSSWGAGQNVIPEHVNRIIRAHNDCVNNSSAYRRYCNNGNNIAASQLTVPLVAQHNLIKASDLSALRTYLTNILNYAPCNCDSCNCDGGGGDSDCNNSCDGDMDCDSGCK